MITPRSLLARPHIDGVPAGADHPQPSRVVADVGLLLACHLAVALAVCLVLDLWLVP